MNNSQGIRNKLIEMIMELHNKGKIDKKFNDGVVMLVNRTFNIECLKIIQNFLIEIANDKKNVITLDTIKTEIANNNQKNDK